MLPHILQVILQDYITYIMLSKICQGSNITINCKRLDIMLPLTFNDGQIILQVIVRDCILYNAPSINCTRLDVVLPLILYNYN